MGEQEDTKPVPRLPDGSKRPRKGGTSRISMGELENVAGFATIQMDAFCHAWQTTLGKPISVSSPEAARLTAADLAKSLGGRHLLSRFVFSGAHPGDCHFLVPETDALVMSGYVNMLSEAEIDRRSRGELSDEDYEALSEVFSHAASRAGAALAEEFGGEYDLAVADLLVTDGSDPAEIEARLGSEPLTVSFGLQISEFEASRVLVAYSGELAGSFKPKSMRITDTMVLPAARGVAPRSLAEELGLEGAAPVGEAPARVAGKADIERILGIRLDVSVRIGEKSMLTGDVLGLSPGAVMQLAGRASQPLGLYVNNHRIAEGHVVVKGEKFAVQLTKVVSPGEMVRGMA